MSTVWRGAAAVSSAERQEFGGLAIVKTEEQSRLSVEKWRELRQSIGACKGRAGIRPKFASPYQRTPF